MSQCLPFGGSASAISILKHMFKKNACFEQLNICDMASFWIVLYIRHDFLSWNLRN